MGGYQNAYIYHRFRIQMNKETEEMSKTAGMVAQSKAFKSYRLVYVWAKNNLIKVKG